MAKGYIIARLTVNDPDGYQGYVGAASAAIAQYGGKPLVRGGRHQALEGEARGRNVVIEFDSYDAAHRFYHSPEYQAAIAKRKPFSEGEFVLVEGVA